MVSIAPFDKEHLEKTYLWMSDANLKRDFLFTRDVSETDHLKWFEVYKTDAGQSIFAIYFDNKHVGNVGLKDINLVNKNAETWIYIGDPGMKGKGIAKKAYELLLAEYKTKLHKIYAHIVEFNLASIKMYKKIGFNMEGIFNDQIFMDDRYYSIFRFAVFL
ncbi:MAG: GNAT family N-acetyltransferase [Bacteroidota bacterium]